MSCAKPQCECGTRAGRLAMLRPSVLHSRGVDPSLVAQAGWFSLPKVVWDHALTLAPTRGERPAGG